MLLLKKTLSRLPLVRAREQYIAQSKCVNDAIAFGEIPILEGSIMPRLSERMRVAVYLRSMNIAIARGASYPDAIDIFMSATEDDTLISSLIAPEIILRLRRAANKLGGRHSRRSRRGTVSADAQKCLDWMVRDLPSAVLDERHVVRALILRSSEGLKKLVAAEGDETLRRLTDRCLSQS